MSSETFRARLGLRADATPNEVENAYRQQMLAAGMTKKDLDKDSQRRKEAVKDYMRTFYPELATA
jgi:DnaJ-class molecular chaperone